MAMKKKKKSGATQTASLAGKPMMQTIFPLKKTMPKGKEASSKSINKKFSLKIPIYFLGGDFFCICYYILYPLYRR
jgi:hypothetical protein